jgi:3-hydroxyacyl-[acyl-carrier-protein] dehydratase
MLEGPFFKVQSHGEELTGAGKRRFMAGLQLNPGHPIYQGHFPGQPVVPGVCQIRIVHEIAQKATGIRLRLVESDTVKFLLPIDPLENPCLDADLLIETTDDGRFSVNATLGSGSSLFLKFKGKFESRG